MEDDPKGKALLKLLIKPNPAIPEMATWGSLQKHPVNIHGKCRSFVAEMNALLAWYKRRLYLSC